MSVRFNTGTVMTIALIALAVAGLGVMLSAWADVRQAIGNANWRPLLLALVATAITYAAISVRFAALARAVRIRAPFRLLCELGGVSTLLGRVAIGGGTAGMLLRIVTLKRRSASISAAAAASIAHSYLSFILAIIVLVAAIAYAASAGWLGSIQTGTIAAATILLLACAAFIAAALFAKPLRDRLTAGITRMLFRATGNDLRAEALRFARIIDQGARGVCSRPALPAMIAALLVIEAAAAGAALWLCFAAIGQPMSAGILLLGYGVGVAVGMVSMIPGGLGVQEGSMAGVYSLLGVPLEDAVATTVLFRAVHYFAPFLASILLYRKMLITESGTSLNTSTTTAQNTSDSTDGRDATQSSALTANSSKNTR